MSKIESFSLLTVIAFVVGIFILITIKVYDESYQIETEILDEYVVFSDTDITEMYQIVIDWLDTRMEGHWLTEVECYINVQTRTIQKVEFNFAKIFGHLRISAINVLIDPESNRICEVTVFKGADKAYPYGVVDELEETKLKTLYEELWNEINDRYPIDSQEENIVHANINTFRLRVY